MLSACASFGRPAPSAPRPDPAPIVERVVVERVTCPAELDASLPPRPVPARDAVIEANPAGVAYLSAEISYGAEVGALFTDAQAACARARTEPVTP